LHLNNPERLTTPNEAARILVAGELHHKRLMEISMKIGHRSVARSVSRIGWLAGQAISILNRR